MSLTILSVVEAGTEGEEQAATSLPGHLWEIMVFTSGVRQRRPITFCEMNHNGGGGAKLACVLKAAFNPSYISAPTCDSIPDYQCRIAPV